MSMTNAERGKEVELRFKEWLDRHEIPYWYIQQDIETFSPALKKYFAKRPDFMILLPNLGFIFVDAEYKKPTHYKTFPIDTEESRKYSVLQRHFNLQVWYALSNEQYHYSTWFWIPVSKVLEIGKTEKHVSSKTKMEFFAIPIDNFIQVAIDDSLSRLLSKII